MTEQSSIFLDPIETMRRLGYAEDAKLLVIHGDDAGMCHSANVATAKALERGIVSSASAMAPCPWFTHFVDWAKANPKADVGLHLTLTSEWEHYRWRPVSSPDRVRSLVDEYGFLWRTTKDIFDHAVLSEMEIEARAQIEFTLRCGLKPTHIDGHMGVFSVPGGLELFVRLGEEYDILPRLMAREPEDIARMSAVLEEATAKSRSAKSGSAESQLAKTQSAEWRSAESQSVKTRSAKSQPVESQSAESQSVGSQPAESQSGGSHPAESAVSASGRSNAHKSRRQIPVAYSVRLSPKAPTLEGLKEAFREQIQSLGPGIWQITLHLNLDDDEIKAVTPMWEARFREFTFFTSDEAQEILDEAGVQLVNYRMLGDVWRGQTTA